MSSDVSRAWQIGYALCCVTVFFVFALFGKPDKGAMAGFSFAVIALALKMRWDLVRRPWFIFFMIAVIIAHGAILFLFDGVFSLNPTILYAPLIVLDFGTIIFLIYILEYLFRKNG